MNPSKLGLLIAFVLLTACGKQVSSNLTSSNTADRPTPSRSLENQPTPAKEEPSDKKYEVEPAPAPAPKPPKPTEQIPQSSAPLPKDQPSAQHPLEPKAPIKIITTTTTTTTTSTTSTTTTLKPQAKAAQATPEEIAAAVEAPKSGPVIIDSCFSPDEPCDKRIIQFINSAKRTLEIAVFSFTHAGIAKAIVKAQERGVKVRMVVDRDQSRGKTSQVDFVMKSGIPLKFGNQEGSMHHKFTIVDRNWLQTGSYNYSYAATSYNAENQIYLKDPELVLKYREGFENLWAQGEEK